MKVLLGNPGSSPLSLDINLGGGKDAIRESIPAGGSVDVGDKATVDDLQANSLVRSLVSAGSLTVSTETEASDVESLLDSQLMEVVQETAASVSETLLGTADMKGAIQVEAQVGRIPASGESMVIDVLVNGSTVLSSPITADDTTVTAARQTLFGDEQNTVVNKGDEISYSLDYTAGGSPSPIINTAVRVKLLKAS